MKKTLDIVLAVCFLMSVTAAAVSAEPIVAKEKKVVAIDKETGQKIAAKDVAMDSVTGKKIVATKKVAVKNGKDKVINS